MTRPMAAFASESRSGAPSRAFMLAELSRTRATRLGSPAFPRQTGSAAAAQSKANSRS